MGTTSEKLTYLNTTKGLIKDSINLTGANITSNDTFRSYATKLKNGLVDIINNGIDTLYDNFPKVTAEGTEIALNNTYEAPIKLNVIKGNTQQNSYTGKNQIGLQDLASTTTNAITYSISNGVFSINGTASAKTIIQNILFNLSTNTSKRLKVYLDSGTFTVGAFGISLRDSNNEQISFIQMAYSIEDLDTTKTISLTGVDHIELYVTSGATFGNAKFRMILVDSGESISYEPYVGGKASPNPDYPQNVNVVTGSQSISVNGKNLFNINDTYYKRLNQTATISGNTISINNTSLLAHQFVWWNIPVKTNETITISYANFNEETSDSNNYVGYRFDSTPLTTFDEFNFTKMNKTNKYATITATNSYLIIGFRTIPNTTNSLSDLQVEYKSSATTYEPYSSSNYEVDLGNIELCKIGDYQDYIKNSTGKNLFDGNYANAYIGGGTGTQFMPSEATRTAILKVKPNTTYTVKKYKNTGYGTRFTISEYPTILTSSTEMGANTKLFNNVTVTQATVTTSENGYYLYVYATNDTSDIPYLQIEEGQTASSDYEPYGKVWYKKANIGKLILDGEYENWTIDTWFTSTDNSTHFKYAFNQYNDNYIRCISNYFIYKSGREQNNGEMNTNLPAKFLLLSINTISTVEDFKTWLGTHNVNVYYVSETPTYEVITDTTLINQLESIKSKDDVTNITISGNLPMIINASALEKE